ncbi:zinc ribbon domain-containing protein [Thomasclavelia spiroformis]|uniref:zinc ribbon domain-containing protein n=1 Tax=Thomasclavelia spiroformis TaxID=29348 RepID=UPI00242BAEBC|nr:zinc ribbon domain-containing protein [Thomasclavelia spiroformis]
MENNKICKNCGAKLLEEETVCPVCGASIIQESDHKDISYWKNKKIWIIFFILVVLTGLMGNYLSNHPIEVADKEATKKVEDVNIKISEQTNKFAQATNINNLAYSYVNKNGVYLAANGKLYVFDENLSSKEEVLDINLTDFSEDNDYYYFVDENNNYVRTNKDTKEQSVLLKNVFYVHKIENMIYYQDDSDGETIHCFNLDDNSNVKINNEVSYNLIVDSEKGRIYYTNQDDVLVSLALDGSDRKEMATNTNMYTYDGEYLYCITNDGLVKVDDSGKDELIYESNGLQLVNIVDKTLVVQDSNTIYTMSLNGKKVKKLYTMDMTGEIVFEVVGDKVLILARGMGDSSITYEMISLDGKRQLLDTNDVSDGIGFEI